MMEKIGLVAGSLCAVAAVVLRLASTRAGNSRTTYVKISYCCVEAGLLSLMAEAMHLLSKF